MVLVGRDCFPEDSQKKVVFTFIFSQIALQLLVLISEGLVAFISSRGTISNPRPRRFLPHFLVLRAVLYAVEVLACALAMSPGALTFRTTLTVNVPTKFVKQLKLM